MLILPHFLYLDQVMKLAKKKHPSINSGCFFLRNKDYARFFEAFRFFAAGFLFAAFRFFAAIVFVRLDLRRKLLLTSIAKMFFAKHFRV